MKLTGFECGLMPDYNELFPSAINLFSTRTPIPCITSIFHILLASGQKKKISAKKFSFLNYLPFPEAGSAEIDEHRTFMKETNEAWKYSGEDGVMMYVLALWYYLKVCHVS